MTASTEVPRQEQGGMAVGLADGHERRDPERRAPQPPPAPVVRQSPDPSHATDRYRLAMPLRTRL